ncbi:GroES-like protein [Ceraceosorus guamensis]|uniref:GroES-like protein n=1 Tax=Ceraceosorus guamensis TaxID=1522189 RepID=A0A316W7D3_9BASI|nr:GroES-like protein [Ceraceosorus guamensis]PWN45038.1 GroES-like protein [Ceraceosorus guamensis]
MTGTAMQKQQQQLPTLMKGLTLDQFVTGQDKEEAPYKLKHDLKVPSCSADEVVIHIAVAAVCHTDGMVVRGEFEHMMRSGLPLIPSHEPTGIVAAIGERAAKNFADSPGAGGAGPLKIGDRVGSLAFKDFCGECEDCKAGKPRYCENQDMCGVTANGGLAEYMAADYRSVVRLPDEVSFEAAAPLFCAGATIFAAIRACDLKAGQRIAIVGAGALGHLGVQFAKCLGLHTIVVDARDAPLELCKDLKYPPDEILNAKDVDVKRPETVKKAIESIGGHADAVVLATDTIPACEFSLELTKKHGLFMVVGQPNLPIPVPFHHLVFRDVTIKGSLLGDPADVSEMLKVIADKGIEVKTKSYPLEKIHDLLTDYSKPGHAGKLVVRVSDHQ